VYAITPDALKTSIINIREILNECPQEICQDLKGITDPEMDQFLNMFTFVAKSVAVNLLAYSRDIPDTVNELKALSQLYKKFLKDLKIHSRAQFYVYQDQQNNFLGSTFLPIKYDQKSEVVEYEASVIEDPVT